MKNKIFSLVLIFLFTVQLFSQSSGLKLNHIGLDQGLSQSTVYSIAQDAQGFIWFATQDGLDRYDGYSMTVYKHKSGDKNSIADNAVSYLLSDPPENLWVGTFKGGLDRYDIKENKFHHYKANKNDSNSVSDNRINLIFRDSLGTIWVGTNEGLNYFDRTTDSFRKYISNTNPVSEEMKHINSICQDNNKMLWVGTGNGLFKINLLDINDVKVIHNIYPGSRNSVSEKIYWVFTDHSGTLWVGMGDSTIKSYSASDNKFIDYPESVKGVRPMIEGTDKTIWFGSVSTPGLRKLDLITKKITLASDIQNDNVLALFKDNSGIIWIGTYFHGVYFYDYKEDRFKNYLGNSQNPNIVMSIFQDHSGNLWVGTFGNGVKYFSNNLNSFSVLTNDPKNPNSISSNTVLAFAETPANKIWIATYGGGLDCYDKITGKIKHYKERNSLNSNGVSSNSITSLYKDHNDNLWIGHYFGEIDVYNHSTGIITKFKPANDKTISRNGSTVTMFNEANDGTMWIGTQGNGLLHYFPKSNAIKQIQLFQPSGVNKTISDSLPDISSFYIADDGIIWIGTVKDGLIKYDPTKNLCTSLTLNNYLSENSIYGILHDSSDNLWISTDQGIIRFNVKTGEIRSYDKYDGLQSNEFNQGAYFKNREGQFFFGGVNGFNSFFPELINDNKNIPPVYLTSFKIFDKNISTKTSITFIKKINLSYSQNFFSFEFVALNYTLPQKNKYAYKLEGFDKDWHIVPAQQRFASYTNLDPAKYILHIKGSNDDGIWNNSGTAVSIIITPPFWMTWWFRLIALVFLISVVYALFRYRIVQLLKMERMRLRIANDLHDELGSDLSAIALASQMTKGLDQNDNGRLNKIRENSLRAIDSMREIVWFIKPEHDSPEKLLIKINEVTETMLEGKDFNLVIANNALRYFQNIESRQNLFLIYKECLTNIVRHSGCSKVDIELGGSEGKKLLSIKDNGVGFDPAYIKKGSGLNSLNVRALRIKSSIKITSSPGEGTLVELFPEK
jgi:ligand-binding sensor domain-containing protein